MNVLRFENRCIATPWSDAALRHPELARWLVVAHRAGEVALLPAERELADLAFDLGAARFGEGS